MSRQVKRNPDPKKRFWAATFIAWLVFLVIDFLMHASLLRPLWKDDIAALKPAEELFKLIPFGYLSFFILTFLVGWVFQRVHPGDPGLRGALIFGAEGGVLFGLLNSLALYSYINLPATQLVIFNLVYSLEIIAVVLTFRALLYPETIRKRVRFLVLICLVGLILGVVLQNLIPPPLS